MAHKKPTGKTFLCVNDVRMHKRGRAYAFRKGKVYKECYGAFSKELINEQGESHGIGDGDFFKKHFRKA